MSQAEQEYDGGNSCINCGEELEEFDTADKCLCCWEDEIINDDLEGIYQYKRSGSVDDCDTAIRILKQLIKHYSHRTERYGFMDIAPELMEELIELKKEAEDKE